MLPYIDSNDPDPRPKQQPGESNASFRQRETDWYARWTNPSPVSTAAVGMPTPTAKYGGVGGTALGGFRLEPAGALPAPTYRSPAPPAGTASGVAPNDFRVSPIEAGSYGPPFSAGLAPEVGAPAVPAFPAPSSTRLGLFGPVGAVAPGMREPRDPTPEELERSRVLTATGFDTEWGTPGDGPGVRWSPTRYLYEPTNDLAGAPYASVTATNRYLQAYRDTNGVWRQRWVLATAWAPNPAVPYRTVGDAESRALWSTVNQAALEAQSFDARWKRGEVVRTENPNIVFVPKYEPVTRAPRLSDFAWIGQKQLPVGCPYPYPALPVPIADYTSGRWLDADYVPSIPLPPPYDQTPWQCGVPEAPGAPHKKGRGAPTQYQGVAWTDSMNPADARSAAAGIPAPTGSAAPPNPKSSAPSSSPSVSGAPRSVGEPGATDGPHNDDGVIYADPKSQSPSPSAVGEFTYAPPKSKTQGQSDVYWDPVPSPPANGGDALDPAIVRKRRQQAAQFKKVLGEKIAWAAIKMQAYPPRGPLGFRVEGSDMVAQWVGPNSSNRFWKVDGDGYGITTTGSVADAIEDIYNNPNKYALDCKTAVYMIQLKGVLDALTEVYEFNGGPPGEGKKMFEAAFPKINFGSHESEAMVRVSVPAEDGLFLPGDTIYFVNEGASHRSDFRGENVIARNVANPGVSKTPRNSTPTKDGGPKPSLDVYAHGMGPPFQTVEGVIRNLNHHNPARNAAWDDSPHGHQRMDGDVILELVAGSAQSRSSK